MEYQFGIRYVDMVNYYINMVILDIDMEYGLMIWEMTVSIRSSPISIWDILSLCASPFQLQESGNDCVEAAVYRCTTSKQSVNERRAAAAVGHKNNTST